MGLFAALPTTLHRHPPSSTMRVSSSLLFALLAVVAALLLNPARGQDVLGAIEGAANETGAAVEGARRFLLSERVTVAPPPLMSAVSDVQAAFSPPEPEDSMMMAPAPAPMMMEGMGY